jgi:hypothetical protein
MKNPNEPRKPSQARMQANRENAKKSTGPRSAQGKAASSRNRLLHGLRANKHILLDEDPQDFLFLLHDHLDRFQPVGAGEENLVLRIASAQWRLDRALPLEAGIYRECFHNVDSKETLRQKLYDHKKTYAEKDGDPAPPPLTPPVDGDLPARAFTVDSERHNSFAKLARYETAIERSIDRCLSQLKAYQAARIASTPDAEPSVAPAHPDDPPEAEPEESEVPPAEAAMPTESTNCHSNPKNEGIARSAAFLLMLTLMQALAGLLKRTNPSFGPSPLARFKVRFNMCKIRPNVVAFAEDQSRRVARCIPTVARSPRCSTPGAKATRARSTGLWQPSTTTCMPWRSAIWLKNGRATLCKPLLWCTRFTCACSVPTSQAGRTGLTFSRSARGPCAAFWSIGLAGARL